MPPGSRVFSYKPFGHDEASTHIRVIQIKQGCGEEIRCVMKHIKRPSGRPESTYSCLSYTWQPKDPGRNIYIEGEQINEGVIEVGKNLGDFLAAARDGNVTDWLWIDALCINQGDSTEKGQQVRQMGQTYEHAKKVFVWLSVLIDEPTIRALESMLEVIEEAPDVTSIVYLDKIYHLQEDWICRLSVILSAEYWKRLWIAQEFLLADDPILFFGNFQTGAHKLALFLGAIPKKDSFQVDCCEHFTLDGITVPEDRLKGLRQLPGWKYFWWRLVRYEFMPNRSRPSERPMNQSASLASLIPKFAKSGCQDRRDRVYALLSLADDGDPGLVNYNISEDVVFRNTMALMKRHKRPLDELLLIGEALIETLELWPATSPSSSTLEIKFDGPEDITLPIWGCATLERFDANLEARETVETTCMYVGIHDGPNVHVFEYAVEKPAERPTVKYSRAHEYLRGHPPASFVPASDLDVMYFWLDNMPSETLHYFTKSKANTHPLWSWTAQDFEISGLRTDESTEHGDRDILSAMRIVNSLRSTAGIPWEGYHISRIAQPFLATFSWDLPLESQEYQYDASVPPLAQHPRSTTFRLDVNKYLKIHGRGECSHGEKVEEDVSREVGAERESEGHSSKFTVADTIGEHCNGC
ncbi:hypothetical protein CDV31_006591 [Fusarium ambrosium]|uniref:Heterokaryon incompatibility domain-containing protein n=1 Tax=Fusarium ambrosium TaxID=131363 RepID=A0A428UCD6_9HYPO|nr:hypothetical protein CDV31_006591 [Fusarium ambrosium]